MEWYFFYVASFKFVIDNNRQFEFEFESDHKWPDNLSSHTATSGWHFHTSDHKYTNDNLSFHSATSGYINMGVAAREAFDAER